LGEAALGEDVVDGDGETDFGVFLLGVGEAEIGKDIAGVLEDRNLIVVPWRGLPRIRCAEPTRPWLGDAGFGDIRRPRFCFRRQTL